MQRGGFSVKATHQGDIHRLIGSMNGVYAGGVLQQRRMLAGNRRPLRLAE